MFPVPFKRKVLKNKEWIFGVIIDGHPKAYQAAYFPDGKTFSDTVNGRRIALKMDLESGEFEVTDAATGNAIHSVRSYWFAWQAFYPGTEILGRLKTGNKSR